MLWTQWQSSKPVQLTWARRGPAQIVRELGAPLESYPRHAGFFALCLNAVITILVSSFTEAQTGFEEEAQETIAS
jgi:hypothetical protein